MIVLFFVELDSYAIALLPSLGGGVTRWGLLLVCWATPLLFELVQGALCPRSRGCEGSFESDRALLWAWAQFPEFALCFLLLLPSKWPFCKWGLSSESGDRSWGKEMLPHSIMRC